MATSKIKRPNQEPIRIAKQYTEITGAANSKITLTTTLSNDLGISSSTQVLSATFGSWTFGDDAFTSLHIRDNEVYINSSKALNSQICYVIYSVIPN